MATLTGSSNCAAGTFTINFTATANENSSSVDNINNTSKVNWSYRVYVTSNNVSFSGHTRNHAGIFVFTINGTQVVNKYTGMPNGMGNGTTLIEGSGTTNAIAHSSDGTKTISISAEIIQSDDDYGNYIYYWQSTGLKTGSVTLTSIDRTAGTPTISNVSSTYNSASCNITVPFASTVNQYSKDGSSWTNWNKSISANSAFSDSWSGLSPNTTYTFYYRFRRDYNQVWSPTVSFTVTTKKPAAPTKGSVTVSSKTYNSITYSWSGFSFGAGGTWGKYQYSYNNSSWVDAGQNTSHTRSSLSPNTSYTLYVRLVDNYGTASAVASVSGTTNKPAAPSKGTVSASSITYNGAKLSWSGFSFGAGATWGKYQYSWNNSSWNDCGQNTSLTFTDRSPNTTYNFYVRLVDNYGQVSAVASTSFATPKPSAPSKGTITVSNITESSAVFSWSGFGFGAGATWGHYRYSTNGSNWTSCGTDVMATLTSLSANTSYTFYVQLVDNYGTASSSATVTFKTEAAKAWKYGKYGIVYIKVNDTWKYGKLYYKKDGAWVYTNGNYIKY